MARRTREISVSTTSQSTERREPDQEPSFSLAVLARSWAEVTGELWENILYRVGDWAITAAFPDDAFRTADADDATFHKQVIFDRVRWHRDLVDKIHRAQDPEKRERLQRFADLHMQAMEIAVLRRDVVVEACRAMNVVPPPILGLIEGFSATHRVPPECPPDFPIGVYAREAEGDQAWRHHGDVMGPDEVDKYTLLWDAAREMSRNNGRDIEWNWLRLIDAFWRGDLARAGLVHFYRGSEPGREFVTHNRDALAGLLLGWRTLEDGTREPAHPIDTIRHWSVADYRGQPAPLGDYFERDHEGRLGLAVLTQELDRWRHGETGTAKPVAARSDDKRDGSASRRRGPEPGTVDRYGAKDRALFPELEALLADGLSVTAAALRLAEEGKIAGVGASGSKAKRLADRYRRERR